MLLYLMKEILVYITLVYYGWLWEVFISKTSCENYENTVKSLKRMSSFTFTKDRQWARLASLLGHF